MRIGYPSPQPHGEIRRLLPNFFCVPGTVKLAPAVVINRNMAIVRWEDDLTLVNPVRLYPDQEEKLQELGNIRHIVRLGYYHGCDDLYYCDRFNVTFWSQAASDYYPPAAGKILREDGDCPVPGGRFVEFARSRYPEAALWVPYNGGLLLCCDALQYWRTWRGCNWWGRGLLRLSGFRRGVQVAPSWRRSMTPPDCDPRRWFEEDFRRLLKLPFLHFMGAHGDFLPDNAHEMISAAVANVYPAINRAA